MLGMFQTQLEEAGRFAAAQAQTPQGIKRLIFLSNFRILYFQAQ